MDNANPQPVIEIVYESYRVRCFTARAAWDFIDEAERRSGRAQGKGSQIEVSPPSQVPQPEAQRPVRRSTATPSIGGTRRPPIPGPETSSAHLMGNALLAAPDGMMVQDLIREVFGGVRYGVSNAVAALKRKATKLGIKEKDFDRQVLTRSREEHGTRFAAGTRLTEVLQMSE